MFKVEKIKEKLDLEINSENSCKADWERSKDWPWSKGDMCMSDCCNDCSAAGKSKAYYSVYY